MVRSPAACSGAASSEHETRQAGPDGRVQDQVRSPLLRVLPLFVGAQVGGCPRRDSSIRRSGQLGAAQPNAPHHGTGIE
jgi:hypothetical protein